MLPRSARQMDDVIEFARDRQGGCSSVSCLKRCAALHAIQACQRCSAFVEPLRSKFLSPVPAETTTTVRVRESKLHFSREGNVVSMHITALVMALAASGETTLLDFSAPWCAPCRAMEATVAELEHAGYPVRRIDADRDRPVAKKYNVQSIPCFVLLVDGQEAGRVTGSARRSELEALYHNAGVKPNHGTIARGQSPDPPAVSVPGQHDQDPLSAARGGAPLGTRGRAAGTPPAFDFQQLILASVRLTIEDPQGISHGSGTLIDSRQGEALVLTCGHIFRDSQGKGRITVDLFGPEAPQKVPARLVGYDLKSDVGLVSIRPGVSVNVAPVASSGHRVAVGDKVVTVGCNNGGPATALETKITAIDKFLGPPNVQVAGLPVQGRSGGGLFTSDGQVIGVCNAADPADNEGLYAALAAIHGQLDQVGLSMLYKNRGPQDESALAARAPAMPAQMPASQARDTSADPFGGTSRSAGLSETERVAVAEMAQGRDGAEVICIVRSLNNPRAQSEVIKLDRASAALLRQLAAEREAQASRSVTSASTATREVNPPSLAR
jgi:thiol-disulfide isomerase/thioredoxin